MKTLTTPSEEYSPSSGSAKNLHHSPSLQVRSTSTQQKSAPPISSKPVLPIHSDPSHVVNSDSTQDYMQTKTSMSMGAPSASVLSNKDERKDAYTSLDSLSPAVPPVAPRTGRVAVGTRVLPVADPSGEGPQVKLRHYQSDRKGMFYKKNYTSEKRTIDLSGAITANLLIFSSFNPIYNGCPFLNEKYP